MVSFVEVWRGVPVGRAGVHDVAKRALAPLAGLVLTATGVGAQAPPLPTAPSSAPVAFGAASSAPRSAALSLPATSPAWSALTPAQRVTLKPLEREWGTIDGNRRQKWLEIAARMPRMSPDDQARVQARMVEWGAMTPQQRAQVRLLFQEAKQVAPQNRKESWDAYQALPPDERLRLAARVASDAATAASNPASDAARHGVRGDHVQTKSNIVATPAPTPVPRAVAPTVVQAQPGATTTLMSRRAVPPSHQQVGLPKIAATPDFVDAATLLPQRGAQAAAVHAPVAVEPAVRR